MRKEFGGELCRLFTMLIIFASTYLLRYIGDYFFVPKLTTASNLRSCTLNGTVTFCNSFLFEFYYILSSLIYDFLPISLIVIFHFLAFR